MKKKSKEEKKKEKNDSLYYFIVRRAPSHHARKFTLLFEVNHWGGTLYNCLKSYCVSPRDWLVPPIQKCQRDNFPIWGYRRSGTNDSVRLMGDVDSGAFLQF